MFWNFGTNLAKIAGFFLTSGMKASLHTLAKNLLIPFPPPGKMFNMFNMHRMLLLALKMVSIVRNTPCQIPTIQQKHVPSKFHIAPIREMLLPLNAILKALNCPFASKDDFLGKLINISTTFAYQLFSIMLKCFIKNL